MIQIHCMCGHRHPVAVYCLLVSVSVSVDINIYLMPSFDPRKDINLDSQAIISQPKNSTSKEQQYFLKLLLKIRPIFIVMPEKLKYLQEELYELILKKYFIRKHVNL